MAESRTNGLRDPEELVLQYLADPRADLKDLIIVEYGLMVERVARRFSGLESQDDLVQVGYIGLLNALSKFDPSAGVRFNTYATHLVAGEIKHYLRDRSQTIRHPAWLQELRHKVTKVAGYLQAELGRVATEREIADQLGVSESAVQEVYSTQEMLKVASLDVAPGDDDESESDVDRIESANAETLSLEDKMVLQSAMQQLRDLEREVLVKFHFESLNQTEIAHQLGISCNYVSHILRQSHSKLRRILDQEEMGERTMAKKRDADSIIDPESGTYDEHYFRNRLDEEVHRANSEGGQVALLIVRFEGLDGLRQFYGEVSVSDFVADASDFLRAAVRRLDIVCRADKTSFGVVLPGTGPTVSIVRERLTRKLDEWLQARVAPKGPVRVRFGMAFHPESGSNGSSLLKAAMDTLVEQAAVEPVSAGADLRAA